MSGLRAPIPAEGPWPFGIPLQAQEGAVRPAGIR